MLFFLTFYLTENSEKMYHGFHKMVFNTDNDKMFLEQKIAY